MEKKSTPLLDEHLQSLQGMQEAETDPFFYTRLKAKMENQSVTQGWGFSLKPALAIISLVILLAVNGFMLVQQFKTNKTKDTAAPSSSSLEKFAQSYDQTISSSY